MSVQTQQIHRRKSSKDDTSILIAPSVEVTVPDEHEIPSVTIAAPPPRQRTQSTPQAPVYGGQSSGGLPPSAGPYRSTFAPRPLNGHGLASPLRSSFAPPQMNGGHARTRSTSTPFSPVSPSPLSSSFPPSMSFPPASAPGMQASRSLDGQPAGPTGTQHARRHSRMHSRNLSVFFPRPGALSQGAISEDGDGAQEVTFPTDEEAPLVPSAGSSVRILGRHRAPHTPLGEGFTFGQRPPPSELSSAASTPTTAEGLDSAPVARTAKRGHHHKHSLSHNFFSFLPPQNTMSEELHTQPTPTPQSPWGPISAIPPDTAAVSQNGFKVPTPPPPPPAEISQPALLGSIGQFALGAYLWVVGQQVGSLAVTGLGYWVVFDAFGIALNGVVPGWLASASSQGGVGEKTKQRVRRPYGHGRVETVFMFAQAVYLVFSSVYVCKESVEHLLLSAGEGGADGHHHHHGDEGGAFGIDFPIFMTFITFLSLIATAVFFENNTKIVNITGNRIPSIGALIRSIWAPPRRNMHTQDSPPATKLGAILSNPFVLCPLGFCLAILGVGIGVPFEQHRTADLALAMIIAVLTFRTAYSACVVLGAVLLQTSPPRGLADGKMEAFLRAMREIERHQHVLHLPAPHIWQLTPALKSAPAATHAATSPVSATSASSLTSSFGQKQGQYQSQGSVQQYLRKQRQTQGGSLVVTLELHVREDLADADVLQLTRWAWERCVAALAGSVRDFRDVKEFGEEGGMEVTVGVVKG